MEKESPSPFPAPAAADRTTTSIDLAAAPRLPFTVVGIGASAGGMDAAGDLLESLPADSGMAFVLVPHLPADRESRFAQLMTRRTALPMRIVEDGMPVEADHIYIIRPARTLTLKDGRLRLSDLPNNPRERPVVDEFFRSLAEEQRERAACVILAGMGTDGSAGAEIVKAVGGICVAQAPDSSPFPSTSTPRRLVDDGVADWVGPLGEIAARLVRYDQHPYVSGPPSPESEEKAFKSILALLRRNFSGDKTPLLRRRVHRRMALRSIALMEDYLPVLRDDPAELAALSDDLEALNRKTEEELARVRQEREGTIEELQRRNAELKASCDAVTRTNQELTTLNTQLQVKLAELETSSNDLSSLLGSTDIAVIFLDKEFRIRRFTPAAKALVQLIPSDIGRPLNDLARKFTDPQLLDDAKAVLRDRHPAEREITSDGGRNYVRRILAHRTTDNRIEGVVITFIDISARKLAETHLRQSEYRHRLIIEGVRDYAIFMLDRDGRVVTWSPAAQRILGYTPDEAIGQHLEFISTPEDLRADTAGKELRAAESVGGTPEDRLHRRKDGSELWTSGILSAVREGEELVGFVKIMRDNSEAKRAEAALQQAKRDAEKANTLKDQFLASVSHELRTPLAGILFWAKLLSTPERLRTEQLAEGIRAIRSCAEEQQQLVDDLMDTARIVSGKLRLEPECVDLVTLFDSALETVFNGAREKGIAVSQSIDPALGMVYVDPHRLRQILWNVVNNAVKFTPAGGHISVKAIRQGPQVVITVRDDGEGIAPDFIPRMFERFSQSRNPHGHSGGGLGLGLSIAKSIVELYQGSIRAESDGPGHGSTFTIMLRLPFAHQTAANECATRKSIESFEATARRLRGRRILLVEDNPETRRALSLILDLQGAHVVTATDVSEALDSYESARPDILVSDIGLPDGDGFELIDRIRQIERDRGISPIPAIALSAFSDGEDRARGTDAGFDHYAKKPITPESLLEVLAEALS